MRYKTLFRLGVKFLGVVLIVLSAPLIFRQAADLLLAYYTPVNQNTFGFTSLTQPWPRNYVYMMEPMLRLMIGIYLLLGGEWIVNLAIPSDRPYCSECGFDLSRQRGPICPECGTRIPSDLAAQLDEPRAHADDGGASQPTEER